jgi:HEAT repeat protein
MNAEPARAAVLWMLAILTAASCERSAPSEAGGARAVQRVAARTGLRAVARTRIDELTAQLVASGADGFAAPALEAPDLEAQPAELREQVDGLLAALEGADDSLKRLAREELVSLGSAATALLREKLFDAEASQTVRLSAAQVLGETNTRAAAEALVERIELPLVRQDPEGWLRAHCAWRLGGSEQDWIVPRLILTLRYEKHDETVVYLARTLAHFGVYSGLDALFVVASRAPEPALARAALADLARDAGHDDPAELLRAWNAGEESARVAERFSPARELEVWKRIERFSEWQLRGVDDSRFVLSREHAHAAPLLAAALDDADRYIRAHSAQCLERMGRRARAAGPKLLEVVDDPEIGDQVLLTLGAVGHQPAEATLIERTARTRPLEVRVAAARSLGLLGLASSAAALRTLQAADEPLDLRVAALCSLAACAPSEMTPAEAGVLLEHFTGGLVDSAGPEIALERWLEAGASDPDRAAVHTAWRAVRRDDPRERIAERADLLRAHLAASN